jgi:hypothetical protein
VRWWSPAPRRCCSVRSETRPLDLVGAVATIEERVEALLADDDRRRRLSVRLRRHVHGRLATRLGLIAMVDALGIDSAPSERISVLLATRRPDRLRQVVADLAAQRHPDVELIVLPHGRDDVPDGLPGVARVQPVGADRPLGAVLNVGLDLATGPYVAKVDDDDRYGPHHLGDQLLAVHHSGAQLVGRRIHGVYDESADQTVHPAPGGEERFEDHLPGGTLLLPTDVLRQVRWRHVPRAVDTELVRAVHLAGGQRVLGPPVRLRAGPARRSPLRPRGGLGRRPDVRLRRRPARRVTGRFVARRPVRRVTSRVRSDGWAAA